MPLTKEQLCEALALDYADRASKRGANYEASYDQYIFRCNKRTLEDLQHQHKVQNLK